MGVEPDVKLLWDLEDRITEAAAAKGFAYVGRLRNDGDWQLAFYGAGNREPELEALVVDALAGGRPGYRLGSKEDASWSYYDEFLTPNEERWHGSWIGAWSSNSRRRVDVHATARPVDHFIEFRIRERDAFMSAAAQAGFRCGSRCYARRGRVSLHGSSDRSDAVTLQHIPRRWSYGPDRPLPLARRAVTHGWGAPIAERRETERA
jgi:hypothetical protein